MNNAILFYTTFNGKPVIGGSYNPSKRFYVKKCKHANAGKHPHKPAYGGIDDDVIQQLDQHECWMMKLCLADGTELFIRYSVFKAQGFSVNWRDPRFGPRWYCASHLWHNTLEEAKAAKTPEPAPTPEPMRRKEKEPYRQGLLFDMEPTPAELRQTYEQGYSRKPYFSRTGRWPE
jgi:hypothetical protein